MTGRKCLTCKHYEASPIWRKGWCRNPLLYAPQQSHLVQQDDLDCSRGLGNFWEAADPLAETGGPVAERPAPDPIPEPKPARTWRLFPAQPVLAPAGAVVMSASGGGGGGGGGGGRSGGGFSGGTPPPSGPPRPDRTGGLPGQERIVSYQPEERYWTDYLRIALPVVGLLLMLGLFWFWANSLIGDDSDEEPLATATVATTITTVAASTATPTVVGTITGVVPTTQPPPASVPPTTSGGPDEPDETAVPDETDAGFAVDTVVYTTDGVNFRNAPSTDEGTLITELPAGTLLTVIGAPEEGADLTWYPVVAEDGTQGYIAEQFLSTDPPA